MQKIIFRMYVEFICLSEVNLYKLIFLYLFKEFLFFLSWEYQRVGQNSYTLKSVLVNVQKKIMLLTKFFGMS